MIRELALSAIMVTLTVLIHGAGLVLLARLLRLETHDNSRGHLHPASMGELGILLFAVLELRYYFSKIVEGTLESAIDRVRSALATHGFGIISDIDMAKTLKEKVGADFRPYRILGACNPNLAHEALRLEDKVGTMLPCNVIVQEISAGTFEVAAINPVASMTAIENDELKKAAGIVGDKLRAVIEGLPIRS